jgi:hypothetical protein
MTATTVHVANIAHDISEAEVTSFFSFCGKINHITLTPTSGNDDADLSATITFDKESAAKTATLLDGTPLKGSPLSVKAAHSIDEIAGSNLAPTADIGPDGEIPQEAKSRSAIFAEYLANGYVLGDTVLQRGIELDKQHGLTAKFASFLTNTLQTIDSKTHASDTARTVDQQYKVSEKATSATTGLARYFEKALGTGAGQRLRQFYENSEKQVRDIHGEAKRLADMKINQKRRSQDIGGSGNGKPSADTNKNTCVCGGTSSVCECRLGTCACDGCAKAAGGKAEQRASVPGQSQQDVERDAQDTEEVFKHTEFRRRS